MPTTSHENLDDTIEAIPSWAMEWSRQLLLRESRRLPNPGEPYPHRDEPNLPYPELRTSLTEAIAQALVEARYSGERIAGTENERARDISQDQANELQDVLRTLTSSGTALIRSARDLVRRYEKLQKEIAEPKGNLVAGGEAEQLREGIEKIMGELDGAVHWDLLRKIRKLFDQVDARDSLALLAAYDDLARGVRNLMEDDENTFEDAEADPRALQQDYLSYLTDLRDERAADKRTLMLLRTSNDALNLAIAAQQKVTGVYAQVAEERVRQDQKWGEQNHDPFVWFTILGEEYGEACQEALSLRFWKPGPDWTGQAGSATEYRDHLHDRLRAELVQVAAVAISFIECLDREIRQWGSHSIPEAR